MGTSCGDELSKRHVYYENGTGIPYPGTIPAAKCSAGETKCRIVGQLNWYEEQFRLAQKKRFGASSEKTHPDQLELNLFNEAEVTAEPEPENEQINYERRKTSGKRETDLSKLPVETVTYALDEGEQICGCCSGRYMK
ncbi:transposase [Paenibacillus sp. NPDC056933]|uniref:transposase n=1 Tax=Paenibacillus sp. NPDC056933 TaxID=3345968 RepID=UPI003625BD1D